MPVTTGSFILNNIPLIAGIAIFLLLCLGALALYLWLRKPGKIITPPQDLREKEGFTNGVVSTAPTETGKTTTLENDIKKRTEEMVGVGQSIAEREQVIAEKEKEVPPVVQDSSAEAAKKYWDSITGRK